MAEIEFEYLQEKIKLKFKITDKFSNVFNKYYQKVGIEPNSVLFMAHSMSIPGDKKILDIMDKNEKLNKKMKIVVLNDKVIKQSKEIICPKCLEQCKIKIKNYLIELYDCKNNHSTKMKLDEFKESQKIDLSKIKCDICNKRNMGHSYHHIFYYCLNCRKNICNLCKQKHYHEHSIINYDQKNYICHNHNNSYFKYCHDCKINVCMLCNEYHLNHKLESFEEIISNPDSKRIELDRLKNELDIFNNNIKKIINELNHLIENLETYYQIFNNILNNSDFKNKNYQLLKNVSQIDLNNNDIYKEICEINQNKNYAEKVNKIFNVYFKVQGNENNNEISFNFLKSYTNAKEIPKESNKFFLFSDIPSYIEKEKKISKDSIYRCKYCPYIPLMKIMYKGYKVYMEYRCQNGHYSYENLYDFYKRKKNNSINSAKCCVENEINDESQNFYYCNDCQEYYCEKDKANHEQLDDRPHNLINLKYIDNICSDHQMVINDYCLDCHKNICNKCKSHSNHKKVSISKILIDDKNLEKYRKKLDEFKINYNNFYDECDKTIKEVYDYMATFNENLIKFKKVNDYSFNICEDLLNSYQYLKSKNALNYEIIENINSVLNFNDIKFNMNKKFNCIARLIYINSVIKLEYNSLFKLKNNFINFDLQITEEEENLIKAKNKGTNLEYKQIVDSNFQNTYYGYFRYNPDGNETMNEINGFGIKINRNYKYMGEFKSGKCHGYGIYYFESGAYKFAKNDLDTTEAFKLYAISGQVEFCLYNKIIEKYQKYGLYYIEKPNGTIQINVIKNNNFDDYGIMYNINGEFYEGYYLGNARHGYGIFNSQAENKTKIGLFDRGELKFGKLLHKDWASEGEFNMGLKNGYIVEYDQLKRKQFEGIYKDGKREGFGINYYDNGNISYKGYFTNNLEDKFGFMYNSAGKVFYVGNIDKGQKRGFGIYYAYGQKGNKLYQYTGNWVDDDKCDGYLLKKYPDGDYFFGYTKMFVYQTFMNYKLGNVIYTGETKVSSTKREGYGETSFSEGNVEKGIYINDVLEYDASH